MTSQILPIAALLTGSAFLLLAGGVNALILPVRGAMEGFSPLSLGLLGTGYAFGYVMGCILVPRLVARVGHIRSFSVMAAFASCAVLASLILMSPWAWVPLRAISGFCFAGAAMIVESWLTERSEARSRGTVFGVYTMINLGATMAGQLLVGTGNADGFLFFVIAAMLYALALVPTAVSSSATPQPLVRSSLDLRSLFANSPIAVVAAFFIGISNASFSTLSAVYAATIGLPVAVVVLFASVPLLAGAIAQVPIGLVSDRMDRRIVLCAVAAVAIGADLVFVLSPPGDLHWLMIAVAVFGASIFAMYPIIVAHANDHAEPEAYIRTSSGLLMMFGVGSIIGPLAAGAAMAQFGVSGLFLTTVCAHVAIVCYALWRIARRAAVASEDKTSFVLVPLARTSTPQTAAMAQGMGDETTR